jgi:hypothetical protein
MDDHVDPITSAVQLYNFQRKAYFNQLIYAEKLSFWRRINFLIEMTLIVSSSGTVGAWALWHTRVGSIVWAFVAGTNVLLAVAKPMIGSAKRIERYSKLWSGYTETASEMDSAVAEMQRAHAITLGVEDARRRAERRFQQLAVEDDVMTSRRVKKRMFEATNKRFPISDMWLPATPDVKSAKGANS